MGVPLGIPPAPDDAVLARLAPEECIFYTTWAGMCPADAKSKNQAEQMLAEPEVRRFIDHLEKLGRRAVTQGNEDQQALALTQSTYDTLSLCLRHQTTLYVSDLKINNHKVSPRGGMIISLGADTAAASKLFHENVRSFFLNLNVESLETVTIDGARWYRVRPRADAPVILVGIKGAYLIAAVGEGSLEAIVARMDKPVPSWLANARALGNFDRQTGLSYINLQRLRETLISSSGDTRMKARLELLGLTQSPWLVSASGLVGEDVVTRSVLPIEGSPRGLLRWVATSPLKPDDLALIPVSSTLALAARVDVQKTIDELLAATEKAPPEIKAELLDPIKELGQTMGIDPKHDLFGPLGNTWSFYNSPADGGLVLTGLTGVVSIGDRTQFSKSYAAILRVVRRAVGGAADPFGRGGQQFIRRFRFEGNEVHYVPNSEIGFAPAWCATDRELVVAMSPQNVKAYLTRQADRKSLAALPEIASLFASGDDLLAVGYLDAPKLFEAVYPMLMLAAPTFLGTNGLDEVRRDLSMVPSLPSVCRHLRPGIATLRRTKLGLEMSSRGSMPGFGLVGPVMFLAWDSEWLNLVFGEAENNGPPLPVMRPAAPGAGPGF